MPRVGQARCWTTSTDTAQCYCGAAGSWQLVFKLQRTAIQTLALSQKKADASISLCLELLSHSSCFATILHCVVFDRPIT